MSLLAKRCHPQVCAFVSLKTSVLAHLNRFLVKIRAVKDFNKLSVSLRMPPAGAESFFDAEDTVSDPVLSHRFLNDELFVICSL